MKQHGVRRPVGEDGKWGKLTPRTIRFHDRDWERIETFAVMRGMSVTELIRATVLTALGEEPAPTDSGGRLAPQIEQMFRYTHIIATALRSEMLKNGRGGELEELIRSARELQGELSRRPATRPDPAAREQGEPVLVAHPPVAHPEESIVSPARASTPLPHLSPPQRHPRPLPAPDPGQGGQRKRETRAAGPARSGRAWPPAATTEPHG